MGGAARADGDPAHPRRVRGGTLHSARYRCHPRAGCHRPGRPGFSRPQAPGRPRSRPDGRGATWDTEAAMDRVHAVVGEGADIVGIVDIGGGPAALGAEVTIAEEIRRTVPFVAAVRAA